MASLPGPWQLGMSSTATAAPVEQPRFIDFAAGLGAGASFSIADVLGKVVFASGMDVLSLVTLRGVLSAAFFWWWLRVKPPRARLTPRTRNWAVSIGILYAGNVFGLLLAIQLLPLSIAILAYFIYPLLTGITAGALRLEHLGWQSFACAVAAFCGLALMLGTQPDVLAPLGLIGAFGGSICRTASLLLIRSKLGGTDPRLTTWYTLFPSAVLFVVALVISGSFHPPLDTGGWFAFAGMSCASTLSTLLIFISTARVGAFRTAVLLNAEPVLSSGFSFALLGETASGLQLVGGGIMILALCAFQLRRRP